jgi:hypothetical protein
MQKEHRDVWKSFVYPANAKERTKVIDPACLDPSSVPYQGANTYYTYELDNIQ